MENMKIVSGPFTCFLGHFNLKALKLSNGTIVCWDCAEGVLNDSLYMKLTVPTLENITANS